MIFDYYASLAEQKDCPKKVNEWGLTSGFADGCLVWSCGGNKAKNEARKCYMKHASKLKDFKFPQDLNLEPDFSQLPDPSWFGIEVEFELLSPWYSKDDRPFHILDNPVRKDRVFGVPFMSAASWKGLLRWACRMQRGLYGHLEKHDMKMEGWKDPEWIVHLFGNERSEGEKFTRGALMFYPTWFDQIGFEVINPHKRNTRAGTQPIYYEVVPAGTKGSLRLLYAPLPGEIENDRVKPADLIDSLIDSIKLLLETYGISAKRTTGWGAAKAGVSMLFFAGGSWMDRLVGLVGPTKEYFPPKDKFKELMDENGNPIEILQDENGNLLSKTKWKKLGDKKPHSFTNADFEAFKAWYESYGEEHKKHIKKAKEPKEPSLEVKKRPFDTLADFRAALKRPEKGGKGGGQ